jgi:hypothetical protein
MWGNLLKAASEVDSRDDRSSGFWIKPVCGVEKMGRRILVANDFDSSPLPRASNNGVLKSRVLGGGDLTS